MTGKSETGTGAIPPSLHSALLLRMATQSLSASPNWIGLQGRVLDGGYELEQPLATRTDSATFKVRVLGDRFAKISADIFAPGSVSPEQFLLWRDAREFQSPHLSSPIAVSNFDWEGASYPYVLSRQPDETLAGVVGERTLTPDETRELVRSVSDALEFLHTRGFVHSCLSPREILAVGNAIQLSTLGIRRINAPVDGTACSPAYVAPECATENVTPAADIWSAGATIYEVLTGRKYAESAREQVESLPAPFNSIVYRSLDPDPQARCTLADVQAMLRGEQVSVAPKVEVLPSTAPVATAVAAGAGSATSASATAAPRPAAILVRPVAPPKSQPVQSPRPKLAPPAKPVFRDGQLRNRLLDAEQTDRSSRFRFWTYAILGMLLVIALLWITRPRTPKAVPSTTSTQAPPVTPAPAQNSRLPGSQSRVVGPTAQGTVSAPGSTSAVAGNTNGEVWRVVVYTFAKKEDAQRRVELINKTNPGFDPEVVSNKGGAPFQVTLGHAATREDANRIRQKARTDGLPRDAYVQNYKQP